MSDFLSRLSALGEDFSDRAVADRLSAFIDLVEHHNRSTNLVGKLSRERIEDDLVIDSLLPAAAARPSGRLMDVGSGAGFPGVPLAIVFPEVEVHLVEPRTKRVTFLKHVARQLALGNITVHGCKLERLEVPSASFDFAAAKAFRAPLEWLSAASPWLTPAGQVYVYASLSSWDDSTDERAVAAGFRVAHRRPHPTRSERVGLVVGR